LSSPRDVRSGGVKAATREHRTVDRRDPENALNVEVGSKATPAREEILLDELSIWRRRQLHRLNRCSKHDLDGRSRSTQR